MNPRDIENAVGSGPGCSPPPLRPRSRVAIRMPSARRLRIARTTVARCTPTLRAMVLWYASWRPRRVVVANAPSHTRTSHTGMTARRPTGTRTNRPLATRFGLYRSTTRPSSPTIPASRRIARHRWTVRTEHPRDSAVSAFDSRSAPPGRSRLTASSRGVPGRSGRGVPFPVLAGSGRDRPGGPDAGRVPPITPGTGREPV